MPMGFRGEDATKYLQSVYDALKESWIVHSRNPFANLSSRFVSPPSLPSLENRQPTHAPETAATGSFDTGTGSARNIVVQEDIPNGLVAPLVRAENDARSSIRAMIQRLFMLCSDAYKIPQTTSRMERILREIQQSLTTFAELTDPITDGLSGLNYDLGYDLAWNLGYAEDVRIDCVRDLERQISNMQESERAYRNMQEALLENAKTEIGISITATRHIWRMNTRSNLVEWEEVRDDNSRLLAANRAAAYNEQARAAVGQACALATAIADLENAITSTNTLFRSLEDAIVDSDRYRANQQLQAHNEINAYTNWMQGINSSFSDAMPDSGPGALINALKLFNPRSGDLDLKMMLLGDDIDWAALRQLSWQELRNAIAKAHGADAWEWIETNIAAAERYLEMWGFPADARCVDLLLQKFNDHRMMEQIRTVRQDPRFSIEAWGAATTLEERQVFLQAYMDAVVPIFGLPSIEPLICFSEPGDRTFNGTYAHFNGDGTVWINPTRIDPAFEGAGGERTARQSFTIVGTVNHELRHAYQAATIENSENFMVSQPTLDAWRSNYPGLGGVYILPPPPLPPDADEDARREREERWRDYRNQSIEVDAFGFSGDMPGWEKSS